MMGLTCQVTKALEQVLLNFFFTNGLVKSEDWRSLAGYQLCSTQSSHWKRMANESTPVIQPIIYGDQPRFLESGQMVLGCINVSSLINVTVRRAASAPLVVF